MSDLSTTIIALQSAHAAASLRLRTLCQRLGPKRDDGRLNDVGRTIIFQMLDAGLSNKDIAVALDISSPAVTHYRRMRERAAPRSARMVVAADS